MTTTTLNQFRALNKARKVSAGDVFNLEGVNVEISERLTKYGTGKKTVLSGNIDGEPFAKLDITNFSNAVVKAGAKKDITITYEQREYDGTTGGKSNKVLTESELSEHVDNVTDKMLSHLQKYVSAFDETGTDETLTELSKDVIKAVTKLCEYVEKSENNTRRKKATEQATAKVTSQLAGLDLSLLSDELKEQLKKQLGF